MACNASMNRNTSVIPRDRGSALRYPDYGSVVLAMNFMAQL
jgi:hypothetical protein